MARSRILVVEDDAGVRFGLVEFLQGHDYLVTEAETCVDAEVRFRSARADLVVCDYRLPDGTALDLLPRLRGIDPDVPVVLLTAHGTVDLAVQAIKEGAEHFLTKPVPMPALLVVVERILEQRRDRRQRLARQARHAREAIDPFAGESPAVRDLAALAERAAVAQRPILIQGETGTGKGILARWLHARGPRRDEALVELNCSSLPKELLESELFGHQRGAFTGAVAEKPGLVEAADRGTLFLDEIGDMELSVQPKFLKVLEDQRYRRVGDVQDRQVDLQLIAATHRDLARLVGAQAFRSDLYFRISTLPLVMPPLRERREDIPLLARGLLARFAAQLGRPEIELAPDAMAALADYPWPGNIRELRNVLERAVLLGDRPVLRAADLRFDRGMAGEGEAYSTALTLEEVERRHIARVLQEERGRVAQAAERLGVPRSTLYQRIKRLGIVVPKS